MQSLHTPRISALCMLAALCCAGAEEAAPVSTPPAAQLKEYAAALQKYVHASSGDVDYASLRRDAGALAAVDRFATAPLAGEKADDEKLAAKVNRYNARVLHMVASAYPTLSAQASGVNSQGDFFTRAVKLEGGSISLNDYEATIRALGVPAAHFAVNCGSRGCPRLLAEPFQAATVRDTMARLERDAVAATTRVAKADGKTVVQVIELFFWYGKDFTGVDPGTDAASHQKKLRDYLLALLPESDARNKAARAALQSGAVIQSRTDWDWHVND